MGIIAWIIVGLIVGAIAKLILPGKQGGGWILTLILGLVGAFVGGIIASLVGVDLSGGLSDWRTWVFSILGAIVVLLIFGLVTRGSRSRA